MYVMYMYIYVYADTYIYIHTPTNIFTRMPAYIPNVHTDVLASIYTCMHAQLTTYIQFTYLHTYIHTCIHTYILTYVCAYVGMHTHIDAFSSIRVPSLACRHMYVGM